MSSQATLAYPSVFLNWLYLTRCGQRLINALAGWPPRSAETRADMALLANSSQLPCAIGNGTTKCEACRGSCGTTTRCERAHYNMPDGSGDVIIARAGHTFNFSSRESKLGKWSPSRTTNIPDVGANLNTGTLPDGRVYLTSNACPNAGRMWVGGKNESVRDPLVSARKFQVLLPSHHS